MSSQSLRLAPAPPPGGERERVSETHTMLGPPLTATEAIQRHGAFVANFIVRMIGSRDESEDLAQEVFLQVVRRFHTLRNPDALKAWIISIAVNVVRQRLRQKKLRSYFPLAPQQDYEEVADGALSPEDRSTIARVYRSLDGMPVDERLAWTLRHIEEERVEQVALLCGCSLSTAKRRIEAAQRRLREAVGS